MKKLLAALILIPAAILAALFVYVFYAGPRMRTQPNFRTFQTYLPAPPDGTRPVSVEQPRAPQVEAIKNPLPASAQVVARGMVYYQYYCVFCHGARGDGVGPVGESYTPAPADLRSAKTRGLSDAQLLRAMLTGTGHTPVLERVVPAEHRWYIVSYLRTLK